MMYKRAKYVIWPVILALLVAFSAGCAREVPSTGDTNAVIGSPGQLQVYFPRAGQDPAPELVSLYGQARNSLDVAIYSLTHPQIVEAIIDAHKRGVQVRVITDRRSAEENTQKHAIRALLLAGVPVMVNEHSGLMHLKMSIIDGRLATTGSYNYTRSASERNDEMFVVSTDVNFVRACQKEFDRMWTDEKNFTRLKSTGY